MTEVLFTLEIDDEAIEVTVDDLGVDVIAGTDVAAIVTVQGPAGPPGAPGDGALVIGETPSGTKDGVNAVFAVGAYTTGTTALYRNGLRERNGIDYTESGSGEITFSTPPESTDHITIDYQVA